MKNFPFLAYLLPLIFLTGCEHSKDSKRGLSSAGSLVKMVTKARKPLVGQKEWLNYFFKNSQLVNHKNYKAFEEDLLKLTKSDFFIPGRNDGIKLRKEERQALRLYARGSPVSINDKIRSGNLNESTRFTINRLLVVLEKIDRPFKGLVYRKIDTKNRPELLEALTTEGKILTRKAFTSTTRDWEALDRFPGDMVLIINSKTGKSIENFVPSYRKNDHEVLFSPGSKFKILMVEKQKPGMPLRVYAEQVPATRSK